MGTATRGDKRVSVAAERSRRSPTESIDAP
jgi:hypothetical protein